MNSLFSLYLSALLGFPQTLWRDRHLAHHAGVTPRVGPNLRLAIEIGVVTCVWAATAFLNPRFFLIAYLPGYLGGLTLCYAQGYYEHAGGVTSHYGRLYNFLCFNDGFHSEHHQNPGVHWSELPGKIVADTHRSRWPAMLRWLDNFNLESLERFVLRSQRLQAMVLHNHRRAFERLLLGAGSPERVIVVGGGLFPRTVLLLRELLPDARLTILDANPLNIEAARRFLDREVETICGHYAAGQSLVCDLAVLPLSFDGDREHVYRDPPARITLVHEWIWRPRGESCIVSAFLMKRVNLIRKT